jgi:hypothetical protein
LNDSDENTVEYKEFKENIDEITNFIKDKKDSPYIV